MEARRGVFTGTFISINNNTHAIFIDSTTTVGVVRINHSDGHQRDTVDHRALGLESSD